MWPRPPGTRRDLAGVRQRCKVLRAFAVSGTATAQGSLGSFSSSSYRPYRPPAIVASGSPWPVEAARWMPTGLHGAALC